MKKTLINLMVLDMFINDYPGVNSTADLMVGDEPCPEGWRVRGGYIIYEPGNFHFSQSAAEAITEGWEWHAATEITSCNGTFVVSNYIVDIIGQINSCCGSVFPTQFFTFMNSSYPIQFDTLNPPDQVPPCGAKLTLRWLAVRGTNEARNINRTFTAYLTSEGGAVSAAFTFGGTETDLLTTVQEERVWPDDFIGLEDDGGNFTLVANDVVPGVNERRVSDFDGGTIEAALIAIDEAGPIQIAGVSTGLARIPDSDCETNFDIMMRVNYVAPLQTLAFWIPTPAPVQLHVDWGDGSDIEQFNGNDILPEHEYAEAGLYTVRMWFAVRPVNVTLFELLNTPLTYFAFNPQFSQPLAMQTIQLENCGLTNAALADANFPASLNTLILEGNLLTKAIFTQLETSALINLNLNDNPFNSDLSGVTLPVGIYQLFLNNTGLTDFNPDWGGTEELNILELSDNDLENFTIGELPFVTILSTLALNGNSIPSADLDAALVALDASGTENGSFTSLPQTPAAPLGAGGLAAKANLEGKFWNVVVDA